MISKQFGELIKKIVQKIHIHKYNKPKVISYVTLNGGEEIFEDDKRYEKLEIGKNGVNGEGIRKIKKCIICGKIKKLRLTTLFN